MANIITFSQPTAAPDVKIQVIDTVYMLHSHFLANSSSFFEASFFERWSSNTPKEQLGLRCYHVAFEKDGSLYIAAGEIDPQASEDAFYAVPHTGSYGRMHWYENILDLCETPSKRSCACKREQRASILRTFASLFNIFYNRFRTEEAPLFAHVDRIIAVAELTGSVAAVSVSLRAAILSHNQLLYATRLVPESMLLRAVKLRSREMYHDAFIHLAGKWCTSDTEDDKRSEIPDHIARKIKQESSRISQDLLRLIICELPALNREKSGFIRGHLNSAGYDGGQRFVDKMAEEGSELAKRLQADNRKRKDSHGSEGHFGYLLCARLSEEDYPWDDSVRW